MGTSFCPSCHQKRVVEFGEWLCMDVLKKVPHRHFVLGIPKILRRYFLGACPVLDTGTGSFLPIPAFAGTSLSRCAWESPLPHPRDGRLFLWQQGHVPRRPAPGTEKAGGHSPIGSRTSLDHLGLWPARARPPLHLPFPTTSLAPVFRCQLFLDKQKQPPYTSIIESDALSTYQLNSTNKPNSTPGTGTTFTLKLPVDLKAEDREQR